MGEAIAKMRRKISKIRIFYGIINLKILKLGNYRVIAVNYKE